MYDELLNPAAVVTYDATGVELLNAAALSGDVTTIQSFQGTTAMPARSLTTVA